MNEEINIGDYVICVNNIGMTNALSEGGTYRVTNVVCYGRSDIQFRIVNDKGSYSEYYSSRFKKDLLMNRRKTIEEILN